MKKQYLEPELANEIRKRYDYLQNNHFDVRERCRELMTHEIETTSQVHSYRMENSQIVVPFSVPRNRYKRDIRKGIRNIETAFEWGCSHFNIANLDESFMREIAGRVSPELYDGKKIAKYRETSTRITGASVMPPYPAKLIQYEIPAFIDSLNRQLNCDKVTNRVETAIFSHLHLARMHPFVDGNGRTARVLQNVILYHSDIPPPVIETGERMMYYSLLDKAVSGLDENKALGREGVTEGEKLFYNFIGGKINSSLDKVIDYSTHFH
jgi:Fic family protein